MGSAAGAVIKQHLIDPEICIRRDTCESICPSGAITHDSRNYVVDAAKCKLCMACIEPCPTGAIDSWRTMSCTKVYNVASQLGWDELPDELTAAELAAEAITAGAEPVVAAVAPSPAVIVAAATTNLGGMQCGATLPPWSAAHAYTKLYDASNPVVATVVGNMRVTEVGHEYDTHHIILDLGRTPFPVLEGQSIGVIPPTVDASGRPCHARQYSVASPRDGEREGFNNLSLTVKRVLEDRQGRAVYGVASNNEPVQMQGAEAYVYSNTCSYIRTCWQLQLDDKYVFLDGLVSSSMCDQDKRLYSVWEYYNKLPYMDLLYAPRKRDEEAVELYQADLEDFRDRLSQFGLRRIPDRDIANAIGVYNRGRELMYRLYDLRMRDRPPVTGAEALEVSKAAARLPRERFNELMEQLLDEIQRTGREIKKGSA
jgi:ferredoxin